MDEATSAGPVDVLDFAADGARRRRRPAVRWALASVGLAIVFGAGTLTFRWIEESAPILTRVEVAQIYDLPIAAAPGARNWDPSTKLVQAGGGDIYDPGVEPLVCTGIVNPDIPPVSADVVSVNLTPVVRSDGGQVFSGTIETYRYLTPATAREKYQALAGLLAPCAVFTDQDTRFRLDQVAADSSAVGRADLSFRLRDDTSTMRVTVVRFGNTVTWITTPDTTEATGQHDVDLPDLLVSRLQQTYRSR